MHGKGMGHLRQDVPEYLKQHSSANKFKLAPQKEGSH
ncbi:MAG: Smr/MutS family protein [Cyanobacteria bacterium J06631_2]